MKLKLDPVPQHKIETELPNGDSVDLILKKMTIDNQEFVDEVNAEYLKKLAANEITGLEYYYQTIGVILENWEDVKDKIMDKKILSVQHLEQLSQAIYDAISGSKSKAEKKNQDESSTKKQS